MYSIYTTISVCYCRRVLEDSINLCNNIITLIDLLSLYTSIAVWAPFIYCYCRRVLEESINLFNNIIIMIIIIDFLSPYTTIAVWALFIYCYCRRMLEESNNRYLKRYTPALLYGRYLFIDIAGECWRRVITYI